VCKRARVGDDVAFDCEKGEAHVAAANYNLLPFPLPRHNQLGKIEEQTVSCMMMMMVMMMIVTMIMTHQILNPQP